MKKTEKKFFFEFDNMQMVLFFAGLLTVCLLSFAVGLKVGVKKGKEELSAEAKKNDLRYKIKAPSLLKTNKKPNKVKPNKVNIEKKKAPSIEAVIAASADKKSISVGEEKTDEQVASKPTSKVALNKTVKKSFKKEKINKKGGYFVQVAAFRAAGDAENRAKKLSQKGYKTVIVKADVPGKGTYHRVRLGPFASLDEAKAFALKFEKKEKVSTYIPAN
jgi:cell division septation protein DedD